MKTPTNIISKTSRPGVANNGKVKGPEEEKSEPFYDDEEEDDDFELDDDLDKIDDFDDFDEDDDY